MKKIIVLCTFIMSSIWAIAQEKMILYNGNIVNTNTGEILYNQTIYIKNGIISKIVPAKKHKTKGEIDVSGKFLMPGMIDSHTHFGNFSYDSTAAHKLSKEHLKNGVTTVRDVGGNYLYIKNYQNLVKRGSFFGPKIFYSSIWATGDFKMPDYHTKGAKSKNTAWSRMFSIKDSSDSALETAVLEAKAIGCLGFKLYIHYSEKDLVRLVPIVKKHGMKVWAHSSQATGAQAFEVAKSGVEVMSHAYLIPKNFYIPRKDLTEKEIEYVRHTLQEMKKNNVVLDITLALSYGSKNYFAAEVAKEAYQAGVKFVIGTDLPGCEFLKEIELLSKECGIKNLDILRAATITGAEILEQQDYIGSLKKGSFADILVLPENPIEDLTVLNRIEKTIINGQIAYTRE